MEVKAKEPKVRFGEFTGKWEECRFNEIYKKINEKNDLSFGPDKIISVANMYYKPMRDSTKSKIDYMKTYNLMRVGDIAFESNKSKSYSYGRFVENIIGDGIVSHVFDVFIPITSYDLFFWKYYINNENIMGHILRRVTTKATMMTNLVAKDFLKAKIYVPSIDEQKRIGLFLKQIDSIITLRHQEIEQLKESKKTLLSKMFPKEGAVRPEIRFAGFTDPWELRKLTNITSSYSGLTYSPTDIQDTGIFVLRSSNVKNDQLIDADNVYVNPDIVNSINVKVGDVIIVVRNGSRALIGKHAIVNEEMTDTVIGAFMSAFRGENGNYINALLSTDNFQKEVHKSLGATINQITGKDFSMMIFPTPKFGEQQKIGAFFKQLDYTIALHQKELENLKALKKTLLNLMFV